MTSQERSALVKLGEEYMSTVSSDYPTSCAINILAVKASGVISSREEAQTWAAGFVSNYKRPKDPPPRCFHKVCHRG